MTTAAPPPSDAADESAGDAGGDARAAAARLAAADAARLAAEVRAHQEHLARLQAEAGARAADDARLVAEARVRELEAQLTALLDAQDAQEADEAEEEERDDHSFSLFDGPQSSDSKVKGDGSDPGVLPMALIGVGIVSALVSLLAFFNGRVGFGLVMLGVTVLMLWIASATWVTPIEISVSRGIVYIEQGESKHRFDLRNERTQVEMVGHPGDSNWEVRFLRRGLDPFVVRDSMVDARSFVSQLREWRPDI